MYFVIIEDHSTDTLGLAELVYGTCVNEILAVHGLDLYVGGEIQFNNFVFDCIEAAICTVLRG